MITTKKAILDKDLNKINILQSAKYDKGVLVLKLGLAGLFLISVFAASFLEIIPAGGSYWIIFAAVIGGYMALNIGANDVANTMGPAVGSKTLTVVQALIVAALSILSVLLLLVETWSRQYPRTSSTSRSSAKAMFSSGP